MNERGFNFGEFRLPPAMSLVTDFAQLQFLKRVQKQVVRGRRLHSKEAKRSANKVEALNYS